MTRNLFLSSLFLLTFTGSSFSQQEVPYKNIASVTAGAGILTFNGDVGKGKDVSAYTFIRGGYSLNVEKRFAKDMLGASLNVMFGKLAMGERSVIVTRNNNFESSITQVGLNFAFYLQNTKGIPLIPYITTGFSYAMLDTKTDLKYNGDSLYHYWTDGSIRNLPELPANLVAAKHVTRDYVYETPIDSAASSTMALPIGLGLKMKVSKRLEANIGLSYHLTFSDGVDALSGSGKDKYLYSYFSVTYNIIKESKDPNANKSTVDFASIDKLDMDGDKVNDESDQCPGTPKGVKVDNKGCPLDTDGDGVADYIDKESNTKKGALVDGEGKTVTDAMIREKAIQDSLSQGRVNTFMSAPSSESLKQVDADIKKTQPQTGSSKIPQQFQNADTNKDGVISSSEITAVLDAFFDGTNDYTVEKIHALIEYFFEQ